MLYNESRSTLQREKRMFYFIAKPLRGRGAKLHRRIQERMEREKLPYRFFVTSQKGEGRSIAAQLSENLSGEDAIVVVGGDGSLNDVLCGLKDPAACVLGLIPAGTGNDFAAAAGIPHGIKALDLILGSEPKDTDYLSFSNGLRSLNIAGVGIDVDILLRCEHMKHFHGKSKYFFALLTSLRKFHGLDVRVTADGKSEEGRFLVASACNGQQYGGGIPICPTAQLGDGLLELVYVECPKHKLGALIKLMRGKVLTLPITRHISCREAKLELRAPFTAQYDGELYEGDSFEVKLVHGGLKMFRN